MWVQILKGLYFPNCGFLEAEKGPRASWGWNSLLTGRDIILEGARWQVLSGSTTSIWHDKWVPGVPGGFLRPRLPIPDSLDSLVTSLIDWEELRIWNLAPISHLISREEYNAISAIPIGRHDSLDRIIWPIQANGNFSVKSTYWMLSAAFSHTLYTPHPQNSFLPNVAVWKIIWTVNTIPKIRHFLWRAITGALPTLASLFRRKLKPTPMCPICNEFPETIEHLLLLCPWTRCVWFGSCFGYSVDLQSVTTLADWLCLIGGGNNNDPHSIHRIAFVAFICWQIWKTRCSYVFYNKPIYPILTANLASSALNEYMSRPSILSTVARGSGLGVTHPSTWLPPPNNFIKINTDSSWLATSSFAGLGVVLRNHMGVCIGGIGSRIRAPSALFSEVCAIREGMDFAIGLGLQSVIIESDCQVAIQILQRRTNSYPWTIFPILHDIWHLKNSFVSLEWSWTSRKVNRFSDAVVSLSRRGMFMGYWTDRPPSALAHVLSSDGLPCPPLC